MASVGIAVVSLSIAPCSSLPGLWQIIRIFAGFYNIPIIAVVLVGMLTTHVPALGVKLAVDFYRRLRATQFVFKVSNLHFLPSARFFSR